MKSTENRKKGLRILSILLLVTGILGTYFIIRLDEGEKIAAVKEEKTYLFGVLAYKTSDDYVFSVCTAMRKYAAESNINIQIIIKDGQGDQTRQNEQMDQMIKEKVDVIFLNIVDQNSISMVEMVKKAKESQIPVLFFNREPKKNIIEACDGIYIGSVSKNAGILQGDILADMVEEYPKLDKNEDGKIQYLMVQGETGNSATKARTTYSVKEAVKRGVVMEEMVESPIVANWDGEQALEGMENFLEESKNLPEVILCNNDEMALGVLKALRQEGNDQIKGSENWIPIIGVDAIDEAVSEIEKGGLAATVRQNADAMGEAMIAIGTNKILGKEDFENTTYELWEDQQSLRLPYEPVVGW